MHTLYTNRKHKKPTTHVFLWALLSALFLSPATTIANGGGVWIDSPVWSVGNPVFRNIPEVNILSERLYIKLGYNHSDIKVKYILWNNSDKNFTDVHYAFPVDFMNGDYERYNGSSGWIQPPVNYIEFVANGKPLPHTSDPEVYLDTLTTENATKYALPTGVPGYIAQTLHRKWFYTKITITHQSFLTLEVNYSVNSPCYGDGDAPFEFDEGEVNFLNYDFSPASHWGNGVIGDFYVQLDASELELAGANPTIKTLDEKDVHDMNAYYSNSVDPDKNTIRISGLQFKGEGPVYTCRVRDFNLKESKPLRVNYHHPASFYSLLDSYIPLSEYRVSVSSEQKNYPAGNLTDLNLATAWVPARKGGIGDWITFDFKEKDPEERVIGLFLINGYHKNQALYEQNNRIKRVKITFTDFEDRTDSIFLTLPDVPYKPLNLTTIIHQPTYIESECYTQQAPSTNPAFNVFIEEVPIKTMRLTILDVYKGTKFDDTCISEILPYRYRHYNRHYPLFYDRYRNPD